MFVLHLIVDSHVVASVLMHSIQLNDQICLALYHVSKHLVQAVLAAEVSSTPQVNLDAYQNLNWCCWCLVDFVWLFYVKAQDSLFRYWALIINS